jgi:transmembrane sensor
MDSRQIEERAATWLAKRESAAWGEADQAELARWLSAATAHRVAFIRLEAAWKEANRLKALGAGVPEGLVPPPGEWQLSLFVGRSSDDHRVAEIPPPSADTPYRQRRSRSVLSAIAASFLLAIALGFGAYGWLQREPRFETGVGGLEVVSLADGSIVTLNTNSEIGVEVTETERRVSLRKGEAFFEIAKDAARPFVVTVGVQRVVALGTKFAVRRDDGTGEHIRVVVTEGRVRVGPADGASAEVSSAEIGAGGVARTSDAGVLVQHASVRPIEEYLSWRSGYLVFRDTTLAHAIGEFNRYNTRQIVIADPTVGAIEIGGNFRSTNVDAFVRLLEDGFPIHAEERGNDIVLKSN